jgi:uncharacterized membrane protein
MAVYGLAFLIGVIAGLRTFTPPAAVSWAARLGVLKLQGTWLAFLGSTVAVVVLTGFAVFELVVFDKLPKTQSRKVPVQFGVRLVSGALCGAAIGTARGSMAIGAVAGIIGAIFGTFGGADFRSRCATRFHRDRPGALLEDAVALCGTALTIALL